MLKRIAMVIAACFALIGLAYAQVDVNTADASALDGVKGIGPTIAKRIVDERQAHGPYKDWADFENRVKGVGDKKAAALAQAGLTVNGQAGSSHAASSAEKASKPGRAPAASAPTSGGTASSPEKSGNPVGNAKISPAPNPFNGAPAKP